MSTRRDTLPPALPGERVEMDSPAGRISYYVGAPREGAGNQRPLLLVHSVNAAASAYEMRPLFERYRQQRAVYALDLPGFGFSERGPREYTPTLMTAAVAAVTDRVCGAHGGLAPHALALSLGSEFLARAASQSPTHYASVALVSPTAFNGESPRRGSPGSDRGIPGLYRFFTFAAWTSLLFALLTSRPSIRFFMRKTFGSRDVPPELIDYAWRTSHQPGARHAPYRFVSGYLFSGDAFSLYEALPMPVWMCHGVRGDFQDYRLKRLLEQRPNWSMHVFQTGALPHFEVLGEFVAAYDAFLASAEGQSAGA